MNRTNQFRLIELVMVSVIFASAFALAAPALVASRETARLQQCQENLRQIGAALEKFHQARGAYPPAAIQPDVNAQWVLKGGREKMVVTHANWAILLLPYLGENELAKTFNLRKPISDPDNASARTAELVVMKCPADTYNRPDNAYRCMLNGGTEVVFARGNYAINMGSGANTPEPGSLGSPVFEGMIVRQDGQKRTWWGNGIAGVNQSFSKKDIVNGAAATVALDEVRAGLAWMDSRGAWALGQIGCSATYGHGVYGDAGGPNCRRISSDDCVGGAEVTRLYGILGAAQRGMACCAYCYGAKQATARSMHPHGVNVLMLDGSAHFVDDHVDVGLWHLIHSRESREKISPDAWASTPTEAAREKGKTPSDTLVLGNALVELARKAPPPSPLPPRYANSIGMEFVKVPAGEFVMGMPDANAKIRYPALTPPHWVSITSSFYLGVHPVTQEQYRRVMGRAPREQSAAVREKAKSQPRAAKGGPSKPQRNHEPKNQLPVVQVSWHEAVEFCKRLSTFKGERERAYRLPTEAEWEYACRAGGTAGDGIVRRSIRPVDQNAPNAFGLCGMGNSVFEWCSDWFAQDYYTYAPRNDPQGPATGCLRVLRGAAWIFTGDKCQQYSQALAPSAASEWVGFRVVCYKESP